MDQRDVDVRNQDGIDLHSLPISVRQLCETIRTSISHLRDQGDLPVRLFTGALLLSAAGLKYLHLTTTPLLPDASRWQRWVWIILIELEVFWGIWLLAQIHPRFTRLASALLFTIFAAFSAYSSMMGHESCGCFGVVTVKPWQAFVLDVILAGAFLFHSAKVELSSKKVYFSSRRLIAVLVGWALLGVPIAIFSSGPRLAKQARKNNCTERP